MDFTTKNQAIINLFILSLFVVGFLSFGTWSASRCIFLQQKLQNKVNVDELEEVLSMASTQDKTVIITTVNKAYVEPHTNINYPTMLDVFLEGIWTGGKTTRPLLRHLVVVTMDETAYERCKFRGLNCYRLVTKGVDFSDEKLYMSADYIKMMWARTSFLLHVLKRGYNLIFTDTDILWLRDPFPILRINDTEDLQISTDKFNGNSTSIQNPINAGFYYVKSNNRTISLFETWYHRHRTSPEKGQQSVLAGLISGGIINQLNMTVRFLDNVYFSGFCTDSRDPRLVATVHANCCRSIGAKVADLTAVLRDWKRFAVENVTVPFRWSVHGACNRSWRRL